jgi:hypothetical protein
MPELAAQCGVTGTPAMIKTENAESEIMEVMRRLYFMLPTVDDAKDMLKEMLCAHIDIEKIQFLGKRGNLPPELPEAPLFQKTDITQAAKIGLLAGGFIGIVCGGIALLLPPDALVFEPITVPLGALLGALIGAWIASVAGSAVSNTKFDVFQPEIEQGKVLMIVDVPQRRVEEISVRARKNPHTTLRGFEPAMSGL